MKPKDTIEETVGTDTENDNSSSTETTTEDSTQPKPDGNNEPSGKTFTEAEYKGLQAVIAKRDQTIANLTNEKQELINKLAEAEANHGTAVTEKSTLSEKLTNVTEEKTNLENTVAKLEKKLKHQDIVMKDFPELAPVVSFIPETDTEEEFRAKAKELQGSLNKYIGDGMKNVLSGSSPAVSGNEEDSTLSGDEADKWYREAASLAGISGKEKEYEEAFQKYLDLSK